jgi:hypothetical protein
MPGEMASSNDIPIVSVDDPRLDGMGLEDVAGADQIDRTLAATPDERLDNLVAMLEFLEDARAAMLRAE